MTDLSGWVTVYRASDPDSETEAERVLERLKEAGLDAILLGDDSAGVVEGTREVRVAPDQAERAEALVAAQELATAKETEHPDPAQPGDASHDLDLVTIFRGQGNDAEVEAMFVRTVLHGADIPAFLVGSTQIPSLDFEVQVPRSMEEEAKRVLAAAEAAGVEASAEMNEGDR